MIVRSKWRPEWIVAAGALALTAIAWRAPAQEATAKAKSRETAEAAKEETIKVDAEIAAYKPVQGITGNLNSVGSDTLSNLMTAWTESFKGLYPSVRVQVESKGSGTAPAALIGGVAQLGPMSRAMKPSEIDDFEGKFGYPPLQIRVAVDALAIYVNKDNPIEKLTLAQADAIFGKQRKAGFAKDVITWGDLGLTGDWAGKPVSTYGRNSASGTYGFFKEIVLQNGDYKNSVKEQPGSSSVVLGVTEDKGGIGYSGAGYRTSGVKAVPLAKNEQSEAAGVSAASVYGGKYPLTRYLYVYVNKAPNKPLDPLVKQFLTYVLSQEGQQGVVKDQYFPLTTKTVTEELAKLQ